MKSIDKRRPSVRPVSRCAHHLRHCSIIAVGPRQILVPLGAGVMLILADAALHMSNRIGSFNTYCSHQSR